ncbi:hypothetical protein FQA39_LY18613 [Lamprigera yunnana]|nr:hypothetical protein FQA39_LY18613 [Lamprigera yunnana]
MAMAGPWCCRRCWACWGWCSQRGRGQGRGPCDDDLHQHGPALCGRGRVCAGHGAVHHHHGQWVLRPLPGDDGRRGRAGAGGGVYGGDPAVMAAIGMFSGYCGHFDDADGGQLQHRARCAFGAAGPQRGDQGADPDGVCRADLQCILAELLDVPLTKLRSASRPGRSLGAWAMGDDASMLAIVSSANVACGFHAGDAAGILDTLRQAKANKVVVGAHVAYRDLVGFGRRNMDVAHADLVADVIYQIGALQGLAAAAGTTVQYVKPHGRALTHHCARQAPGRRRDRSHAGRGWQVGAGGAGRIAPGAVGGRCGPGRGGRGLCRPGLHAARHPGAAPRAGRRAARPGPGGPAHAATGAAGHGAGQRCSTVKGAADSDLRAWRQPPAQWPWRARCVAPAAHGGGRADSNHSCTNLAHKKRPQHERSRAAQHALFAASDQSLLVELQDLAHSLDLLAALQATLPPGVQELVPAARTILITFDRWQTSAPQLVQHIKSLNLARQDAAQGQRVEIPVHYDGEDLADVAQMLGIDVPALIALHTGCDYSVAFCGFAPGFAILTAANPRS